MPAKTIRREKVMCPDGKARSIGVYSEKDGIRGRISIRQNRERFDITGEVIDGMFRPSKTAMHARKLPEWFR